MGQQLSWQGANPKDLPFDELKDHIRTARLGATSMEADAQRRIKNRTTAIRAYCKSCMIGSDAEVRMCTAVTCPLHPFRMGGDPFRGFELPQVVRDYGDEGTEDFEMPEIGEDDWEGL